MFEIYNDISPIIHLDNKDIIFNNNYLLRHIFNINNVFNLASIEGNIKIVKIILNSKYNTIKYIQHKIIGISSSNGHKKIVKLLLNHHKFDVYYNNNIAFSMACANNSFIMVKLLLKHKLIDTLNSNYKSTIFATVVNHNHIKIVKLLIDDKRFDPSYDDDYLLRMAIVDNYPKIVKLLLRDKRVNCAMDNGNLLAYTCIKGHLESFIILLNDKRMVKYVNYNHLLNMSTLNRQQLIMNYIKQNKKLFENIQNKLEMENYFSNIESYLYNDF